MQPQASLRLAAVALLFPVLVISDDRYCPGIISVGFDNAAQTDYTECCVGGTPQSVHVSNCEGWPNCKSPPTTTEKPSSASCITAIPFTASDYDELASSAGASLSASGSSGTSSSSDSPSASAEGTASGPPAATTGSASNGSGAAQTMTSLQPESTNAAAAVTCGAMGALGGGIAALAILL